MWSRKDRFVSVPAIGFIAVGAMNRNIGRILSCAGRGGRVGLNSVLVPVDGFSSNSPWITGASGANLDGPFTVEERTRYAGLLGRCPKPRQRPSPWTPILVRVFGKVLSGVQLPLEHGGPFIIRGTPDALMNPLIFKPVRKRLRRAVALVGVARSAASTVPAIHHAWLAVDRRACSPVGTTNGHGA
jgi:hypothetical protein